MDWVHSPSQSVAAGSTQKQAHDGDQSSSEDDADELPKAKQKVNADTLQIGAVFPDGFFFLFFFFFDFHLHASWGTSPYVALFPIIPFLSSTPLNSVPLYIRPPPYFNRNNFAI